MSTPQKQLCTHNVLICLSGRSVFRWARLVSESADRFTLRCFKVLIFPWKKKKQLNVAEPNVKSVVIKVSLCHFMQVSVNPIKSESLQ